MRGATTRKLVSLPHVHPPTRVIAAPARRPAALMIAGAALLLAADGASAQCGARWINESRTTAVSLVSALATAPQDYVVVAG